jgi:3-hydroxyisobutyrate dehydrogenase-like beta-hydroxyacid dehydrogenase
MANNEGRVKKRAKLTRLLRDRETGFRLALGLKDVGLALAAAESSGASMPIAGFSRERLLRVVEHGYQAIFDLTLFESCAYALDCS